MDNTYLHEKSVRPRWNRRERRVVSSNSSSISSRGGSGSNDDQGSIFSTASAKSQMSVRWDRSSRKVVSTQRTHWDRQSKTVKHEGMESSDSLSDRSSVSTKDSSGQSASPKSIMVAVPEQEAVSYPDISHKFEISPPGPKPQCVRPQSADLAALRKREKEKKLRDIMNQVTSRMQDDSRQMEKSSMGYKEDIRRGKDVPTEITALQSSDQSVVSNFSELFAP